MNLFWTVTGTAIGSPYGPRHGFDGKWWSEADWRLSNPTNLREDVAMAGFKAVFHQLGDIAESVSFCPLLFFFFS